MPDTHDDPDRMWPARREMLAGWIADHLEEQPERLRLRRALCVGTVIARALIEDYPGDDTDAALERAVEVAKAAAEMLAEVDDGDDADPLAGPAAGRA
jgi:hypothetical protein